MVEVGGLGTLPRSLKAVRYGGTVAQVGVLAESGRAAADSRDSAQNGAHSGDLCGIAEGLCGDEQGGGLGQLRPVGEEFHWTQAREVLARMQEGSHFGKMVLTVG